jgi:hypothetical protein
MSALKREYAAAVERIRGGSVALVYAHSFDNETLQAFYLRQRTELLSGYADVVDLLGANPVFYNIDQFVELCARPHQLAKIDYIINVPGGSLELDLITMVSNLAAKMRKPIFPATTTCVSLGQNKPIARRLARELGWLIPDSVSFGDASAFDRPLILKPKSAGDSYGVRIIDRSQLSDVLDKRNYMLEEFVEGYDFTVYLMLSAITRQYEVLGGSLTIPTDPHNRLWYSDNATKFAVSGRGSQRYDRLVIKREPRATTRALQGLCRQTCDVFGVSTVARMDFRLPEFPSRFHDIDIHDCRFLEFNALPSITTSGSWQHFIRQHLATHGVSEEDVHPLMSQIPAMQAAMLYIFLSWIVQREDASATGVDQLK